MSGLVLVTGGTGKTGGSLAAQLQRAGAPCRAASRRSAVPFDWERRTTWDPALDGVASVYLVAPGTVTDPYALMLDFIASAMRKGVRRFVFLSMAGLPAGGPAHGQVHQWLKDNSDDWAVLRPSAFMQNFSAGPSLATIREEDRILFQHRRGPRPVHRRQRHRRGRARGVDGPGAAEHGVRADRRRADVLRPGRGVDRPSLWPPDCAHPCFDRGDGGAAHQARSLRSDRQTSGLRLSDDRGRNGGSQDGLGSNADRKASHDFPDFRTGQSRRLGGGASRPNFRAFLRATD